MGLKKNVFRYKAKMSFNSKTETCNLRRLIRLIGHLLLLDIYNIIITLEILIYSILDIIKKKILN